MAAKAGLYGLEVNGFIIMASALFLLTTITLLMRICIRIHIVKIFSWDDGIISAAYVVSIATYGIAMHVIALGISRPPKDLPSKTIAQIGELLRIIDTICYVSMTLSRLSVSIFVLRIFGVNRRLKRFLYVWTPYMVVEQLTSALLVFAQCTPVEGLWDPALSSTARCWTEEQSTAVAIFGGVHSSLSDLVLALLPVYFLYRLRLSARKRIALTVLTTLGLFPAGCAIGRVAVMIISGNSKNKDPHVFTIFYMLGALEMYLLLICNTLPFLTPLYYKLRYGDKSHLRLQQMMAVGAKQTPRSLDTSTWEVHTDHQHDGA